MTRVNFGPLTENVFDALAAGRWPEAVEEWFRGSCSAPNASARRGAPPIDLYEADDAYTVEVALPGVKPEAVELHLHENVLTIAGTRAASEREERCLRRETPTGDFRFELRLPGDVVADGIEARTADGVLTLTLPKRPEDTPRKIDVKHT